MCQLHTWAIAIFSRSHLMYHRIRVQWRTLPFGSARTFLVKRKRWGIVNLSHVQNDLNLCVLEFILAIEWPVVRSINFVRKDFFLSPSDAHSKLSNYLILIDCGRAGDPMVVRSLKISWQQKTDKTNGESLTHTQCQADIVSAAIKVLYRVWTRVYRTFLL